MKLQMTKETTLISQMETFFNEHQNKPLVICVHSFIQTTIKSSSIRLIEGEEDGYWLIQNDYSEILISVDELNKVELDNCNNLYIEYINGDYVTCVVD